LTDRARAMPIRCRWPPENSWGYFDSACTGRPTALRAPAAAALLAGVLGQPVRLHALDEQGLHRLARVRLESRS
jgi:hypothetical protein